MVYAYRADNRRFSEPLFKEAFQNCGHHIRYSGVGSHHKKEIVERRIKSLTLGSGTLLLHTTILWPEAVSTILWPFSFKSSCQKYNILEMNEYQKTPE